MINNLKCRGMFVGHIILCSNVAMYGILISQYIIRLLSVCLSGYGKIDAGNVFPCLIRI